MNHHRVFVDESISSLFKSQTTVEYNIRCGERVEIDTTSYSHILNVSFLPTGGTRIRTAIMNFLHAQPSTLFATEVLDHFDFNTRGHAAPVIIDTKAFRQAFTEVNFYFENVLNTSEYVKVYVTVGCI